jgi:hypothetical protein
MCTAESKRTSGSHPIVVGDFADTNLTQAILASRFPGDTGSARFRQLALVGVIYVETIRGSEPTGARIARFAGVHPTQVDRLAKELEERGVIVRTLSTKQDGAKWVKILSIHNDAVRRFQEAHIRATGREIQLSPGSFSTTSTLSYTQGRSAATGQPDY